VIEALADAMCLYGILEHIRCDNKLEMISKPLRNWLAEPGTKVQQVI
jgi:putative transposase